MRPQAELGKGLVQEVSTVVIHTLEFRLHKAKCTLSFFPGFHTYSSNILT